MLSPSSARTDTRAIHDPVLSVVIPTYNRAYQLDKCLKSLLKQDFPLSECEVIVVDDYSSDNTPEVLEKFLSRFPTLHVIRNDENKGSNQARLLGVEKAKASVVVFTDSDCTLPADWLHKIAEKFKNEKILCLQGTQECKGKWGKFMYEREEAIEYYKRRKTLDTKNLAIKRDLILQYKFDAKINVAGDYELGQRLSRDIEINYDPGIRVFHVCDNFSAAMQRGKNWGKAQAYVYRKHGWGSVNPKFKYPLVVLLFYYLGGLLYFALKYRSLPGGIAFFTTTFLTALHFKKTVAGNLEKAEQDEPPSSKTKFASVLALLLYLKSSMLAKRLSQSVKSRILGYSNDLQEEEILLKHLRKNISRIAEVREGSEVQVRNIERLRGTVNLTYAVELSVKKADGSSNVTRIVGRHLHAMGTYQRTSSLLKLYGKRILRIRPVAYPEERIKAELKCAQKMKEARVKMPDIICVDLNHSCIFTKFIQGENVGDIVHHIRQRKLIEDWQIELFEEIGRGLAEINLKLKIAHGDAFTVNWIYEKKSGNLFLTDWETAGKGDPAWDLAHLIYGIGLELGNEQDTIPLFDVIFRALIKGYEEIDVNRTVVKRFASYWMQHALSVSPKIHERVFHYQGIPLPKEFRVLRLLQAYSGRMYSPATRKTPILNQLIFRFLRACLSLYFISLLISGRTNVKAVIIGDS